MLWMLRAVIGDTPLQHYAHIRDRTSGVENLSGASPFKKDDWKVCSIHRKIELLGLLGKVYARVRRVRRTSDIGGTMFCFFRLRSLFWQTSSILPQGCQRGHRSQSVVHSAAGKSDSFPVLFGLHQGCLVILFPILMDRISRHCRVSEKVRFGGFDAFCRYCGPASLIKC